MNTTTPGNSANPDVAYREALNALEAAQRQLSAIPKSDVEAREVARRALEQAAARVREMKDQAQQAKQRRAFAGLQSPLADVIAARFPADIVAELHAAAVAIVEERQRASAARRAAKAAAPPAPPPPPKPPAPPPPPPRRAGPEVFYAVKGAAR